MRRMNTDFTCIIDVVLNLPISLVGDVLWILGGAKIFKCILFSYIIIRTPCEISG
jgi:hypothetical protein